MGKAQLSMFLVLSVALCGPPAQAADPPNASADWLKKPNLQDIMAVWPAEALKRGLGGKALIACMVTVQGSLRACRVESETPAGAGFGGAALTLANQFLMRPARQDGVAVESTVRIPITFPRQGPETGSLNRIPDNEVRGDPVYRRFPWTQAPSYAEMLAAYPAKARADKVGGLATLDCRLNKVGGIATCDVLGEEPKSYGFAAAAKTLTPRFVGPAVDPKGKSLARAHVIMAFAFPVTALDNSTLTIGRPEWAALPSPADFTAVIPAAARTAGVYQARVVMACTVGMKGALEGCEAQSEAPKGLGYAEAALRLSPAFRLSVWTDEGLPTVGGKVRVPLRFDLDEAMKAAKPSASSPPP